MLELKIFDSSLNFVGVIDDYEYFRYTRKFRGIDDFELQVNRYKNNVNLLELNSYIVFKKGTEYRAVRVEFKEIDLSGGKGSEKWVIRGRSMKGLLEDRICLNLTTSGVGYNPSTGFTAEAAMHYYMASELKISSINLLIPERRVDNLVSGSNLNRGIVVDVRGRYQPLNELLDEISLISGFGYDVKFNINTNQFVFDVIVGLDRTYGNGINAPVMFSPDYDNIKSLTFRNSVLGLKNVAVVGGQGEGGTRTRDIVGTASGVNRKETFVDARDLISGLDQRGEARLNELGEQMIMEFEHSQTGPFEYLVDFDLGDIVTVIYPGIAQMDTRIIEVKEEVNVDLGETFTLTVGNEFPDLKNVIKKDRKNIDPEIRR